MAALVVNKLHVPLVRLVCPPQHKGQLWLSRDLTVYRSSCLSGSRNKGIVR